MGLSDFFYIYFSAPVGTRKTLHIDEEYDADADKIVFISSAIWFSGIVALHDRRGALYHLWLLPGQVLLINACLFLNVNN